MSKRAPQFRIIILRLGCVKNGVFTQLPGIKVRGWILLNPGDHIDQASIIHLAVVGE